VTPRCDRCAALPIRSGPHPPHDLIAEDGVLDDLDLAVNVNAAIEIGKPPVEDNALALRWSGVDFETGTVSIDGTVSIGDDGSHLRATTKTKKSRRIGVSSITLAYLRAHKDRLEELLSTAAGEPVEVEPDPLVFSGGRGSRRNVLDASAWRPDSTSRRFRQLKDRAGVRTRVDLHGLRHTMITEMLAAGVDPRTVMGRAGHSSEATTMSVYAKVRPAIDSAAAEMWGQLLDSKLREVRE
jgi:integrase